MTQTATVNYHVHKPERQAFELDAEGIVGNLIAPELAPTEVKLGDIREMGNGPLFHNDAVGFAASPTSVAFSQDSNAWQADYVAQLTDFLTGEIAAQEVVIFDHTIRVDDPDAVRKPARNVHSDYSPEGAAQRLIDILGAEKAAEWSKEHYAFINVWRPIEAPTNSAPLGFILPSSVSPEDWILLDLIYPDRKGADHGARGEPRS